MVRLALAVVVTLALSGGVFGPSGAAQAQPDPGHASCMGLGSEFYAQFATGQRADVAHIVKDSFAAAPGEHYRIFAQEKEGGAIPYPCGTRIE